MKKLRDIFEFVVYGCWPIIFIIVLALLFYWAGKTPGNGIVCGDEPDIECTDVWDHLR